MRTELKSNTGLRLSTILWFLVIALCVIPYSTKADSITIDDGGTIDIGTGKAVEGYFDSLMVWNGTANLYPGAEVGWVYVAPGCSLNLYGGDICHPQGIYEGSEGFILIFGEADVTIYGTGFALGTDPPVPFDSSVTSFTLKSSAKVTGYYGDGTSFILKLYGNTTINFAEPEGVELVVDVKPGSDTNVINLKSKGVIPVAILTTDNFDAGTINPETVLFADASPVHWTLDDVDGDGDKDMLFHFKTQELNLLSAQELSALSAQSAEVSASASKKVKLIGKTDEGSQVSGSDSVKIISSKK